ncbi:hypothetical protein Q4591_13985 [Shewanella sp. 3_MG-2023]|uniref:hypothetical protein n=1 Tax=Shewanella sp. 3_MG-2023 TaxID=3062635 RepID=UPI0026E46FFC|nr:hypothetical protein [Shewanella sp. 3_MG-2023]MDO6776463.1 hypothetical protein [Shewanella sp. 3_MG-2023]
MKIPFNFKSSLVFVSLFFFAQSIAAEKLPKPWHFDGNIYREALSESISSGKSNQSLLNKNIQWDKCSTMAPATDRMALGVQNNPDDPDFVREMILDLYPVDNDSFSDVINQKMMDLAFEMADVADGDKSSDDSVVTQAAWDWCISQDSQDFADL